MSKNNLYSEFKFKVALEALSGVRTGFLARQHNVSVRTIHNWVQEYRKKFGDEALPTAQQRISESKQLQELEDKHQRAVKLLGEKDLEIEILRDLLKKANPAYSTKSK